MNLNTEDLGSHLERYDFDTILTAALERVPNDIDRREGSIIYDALAPAAMALAEFYLQLQQMYRATFISTAYDNYLDLRVAERGLLRFGATPALRRGYFADASGRPMTLALGTRFSSIDTTNVVTFRTVAAMEFPGEYQLECETPGTIGNLYYGDLLPISHINYLATASLGEVLVPGQDAENDQALRDRFFESLQDQAFGGNVIQYRQNVMEIDGVGAVQVHPTHQGGGTVLLSLVDTDFRPVSQPFIATVQDQVDPRSEGLGFGFAPIGHRVTVTTPTIRNVSVGVHINTMPGTTIGQVQNEVNEAVQNFFQNLRENWGNGDEFHVHFVAAYRSQIMAVVLQIPEVVNVSRVTLDGLDQDIIFEQSGARQELPFVETVSVHG